MKPPLRALIVEDSESDCELLLRALSAGGYEVTHQRVDSADGLQAHLHDGAWDIVISDYSIPGFSGAAALQMIREAHLDTPFIFVSGTIGEDTAVDAMKRGANDYVMKGNLNRLLPAIRRELRDAELRRDHKMNEQRLRQLEKFEAIGQLAGGIAHDFNNIIGAILGWAELGLSECPAEGKLAKALHNIQQQSRRAAGLTRQLLAYARRQILEPRDFDVNKLVFETTTLLQRVIGENIEVKLALALKPQVIKADPSQIEQVVMNLCLNARDAMPKGGELLIETREANLDDEYVAQHPYALTGKHVELIVTDSGTGMDASTLKHAFEPFFTTKEVGKGTGLGLATALGIIRQHRGSIEVESELGKGTTIRVFLPTSAGAEKERQLMDHSPAKGGTETILIAEDNDGMRQMMQETLASLGYRVLAAADGEEATTMFRAHSRDIDLLLLDLVMPRLDGPGAYKEIGKIRGDVPVIFTTGYAEQIELPTMDGKSATLLQKPFSARALGAKIREALDSAATSAANRANEQRLAEK
jgi:signal transduction histidine kinase